MITLRFILLITLAGTTPRFAQAAPLAVASNYSYPDLCAEHDNVNVALQGEVTRFAIIATHPAYGPTNCDCSPDFNGCPPQTNLLHQYAFLAGGIYDNGEDYLKIRNETNFWRPKGMAVTVDGQLRLVDETNRTDNVQCLQIGRKTSDADSWPEFFVLYADGNLRLIPLPGPHQEKVCFGSSVVVGPAPLRKQPFCEIASADYRTATRTLLLTYRTGGTATLDLNTLTRTNAVVRVQVDYPTDQPFCTFRSMFVTAGVSDCDSVWWKDAHGLPHTQPIMSFTTGSGTEWSFRRNTISVHNQSAPDIRIVIY